MDHSPARLFALVMIFAVLLGACSQTTDPAALGTEQQTGTGRYIVVLDEAPNAAAPAVGRSRAAEVARAFGLRPSHTFGAALVGFAAEVPTGRLAALQNDPRVKYLSPDTPVRLSAQTIPTGLGRAYAPANGNLDIDGTDDWRVDVDVAVIDTGIDFEHPDLVVMGGVNCSGGGPFGGACALGGDDDHYHGTHVAGTIGALDNGEGVVGTAPGARLWAVKVLDRRGSGYTSWIVAGIDWVAANAATIEVANMSLGGSGFNQAEHDAILAAQALGVVFVVAAGNDSDDAANHSPAAFPEVVTVSALADFDGLPGGQAQPGCRSDEDDTLANFSNFGSVVDIAAPGVCILSTFPLEQGGYGTISGTSMASPHVAGAAALLASAANPNDAAGVAAIRNALVAAGNFAWSDDSDDGIHEPLLDLHDTAVFAPVLIAGEPGDPGNAPPTASFGFGCSDLACSFDAAGSSDPDGDALSYSWNFGDGGSASGVTANHTYAAAGTYTVTVTVDDGTATDSSEQPVTVSGPTGGTGITLTASGYKVKGIQHVDLAWSGAVSATVDVYRDGALVATTANDGAHTDNIGVKGGSTYLYQLCEAGTGTCSNEATVVL